MLAIKGTILSVLFHLESNSGSLLPWDQSLFKSDGGGGWRRKWGALNPFLVEHGGLERSKGGVNGGGGVLNK